MRGRKVKHGFTPAGAPQPPTYKSWAGMLSRCRSKSNPEYKNYGGRGIDVCPRWESFENFLADMGERPAGLSIGRIKNDKGYEPGNCRWEDEFQQASNRRDNRNITHEGQTYCVSEWSRITGINKRTICKRLDRGWSIERALTTKPLHNSYIRNNK